MTTAPYPRDLIGYGRDIPDPKWPGMRESRCSSW